MVLTLLAALHRHHYQKIRMSGLCVGGHRDDPGDHRLWRMPPAKLYYGPAGRIGLVNLPHDSPWLLIRINLPCPFLPT